MQEKNTREQGEKWTKQREKSTTLCHSFFVEVLLSKINEKRNSNLFFPLPLLRSPNRERRNINQLSAFPRLLESLKNINHPSPSNAERDVEAGEENSSRARFSLWSSSRGSGRRGFEVVLVKRFSLSLGRLSRINSNTVFASLTQAPLSI